MLPFYKQKVGERKRKREKFEERNVCVSFIGLMIYKVVRIIEFPPQENPASFVFLVDWSSLLSFPCFLMVPMESEWDIGNTTTTVAPLI